GTQAAAPETSGFRNEAQTLLAADATKVRSHAAMKGTSRAVRAPSSSRKPIWLGALILLILIAGGVGAFYAYRVRQAQTIQNQPVQNPTAEPTQALLIPTATPAPTTAIESKTARTKVEPATQRLQKQSVITVAKPTPTQSSERDSALRDA